MSRSRNDGKGMVLLMGLLFVVSVGVTYIYFRHLIRRAKLSIYSKIFTFSVYVVTYGVLFSIVRAKMDYNESGIAFVFFIYLLALLSVPVALVAEGFCWIVEKIYDVATMKRFYDSFIIFLEETRQELLKTYDHLPRNILDYLLSEPYNDPYPGYSESKNQIASFQYAIALKADILEFVSENPETTVEIVKAFYERNLVLGMNVEEVTFLNGDPDDIDQKEETVNHLKFRYVYGSVRGHKDYIYFKDGLVNKIQGATV